jgi:hypothetical protein
LISVLLGFKLVHAYVNVGGVKVYIVPDAGNVVFDVIVEVEESPVDTATL